MKLVFRKVSRKTSNASKNSFGVAEHFIRYRHDKIMSRVEELLNERSNEITFEKCGYGCTNSYYYKQEEGVPESSRQFSLSFARKTANRRISGSRKFLIENGINWFRLSGVGNLNDINESRGGGGGVEGHDCIAGKIFFLTQANSPKARARLLFLCANSRSYMGNDYKLDHAEGYGWSSRRFIVENVTDNSSWPSILDEKERKRFFDDLTNRQYTYVYSTSVAENEKGEIDVEGFVEKVCKIFSDYKEYSNSVIKKLAILSMYAARNSSIITSIANDYGFAKVDLRSRYNDSHKIKYEYNPVAASVSKVVEPKIGNAPPLSVEFVACRPQELAKGQTFNYEVSIEQGGYYNKLEHISVSDKDDMKSRSKDIFKASEIIAKLMKNSCEID